MTSYIYKITNLINRKTYVGQYTGDEYCFERYFGGGLILKRPQKKYGIKNFKKEIIIQGTFTEEMLDELEIHYIRLYAPHNTPNSYNLVKGGGSHIKSNMKKVKEVHQFETNGTFIKTWKRCSDAAKHFNVTIDGIAAAARGDVITAVGFLWVYDKKDIGKKLEDVEKSILVKKESCTKYDVWIFKNNIWNYFKGAVDAGIFLGCAETQIYACVRNEKGYHWYKNILISNKKLDIIPISTFKEKNIGKINQFDLNGNFIREWNGLKEIASTLNSDDSVPRLRRYICRNLNGNRNQAAGFIWQYA